MKLPGVRSKAGAIAITAIAAVALLAGACGDDDDDGGGDGAAPTATREASSPAPQATATTETASSPAAGEGVTITTTQPPEGGTFLVNADGFTLYIFDNDVAGSGTSACTGGCAAAWPAATVASASATPTASDDVTGELGTITRDDGSIQVTYKGKPLYRFVNDAAPGDFNGSTVPNWTIAAP